MINLEFNSAIRGSKTGKSFYLYTILDATKEQLETLDLMLVTRKYDNAFISTCYYGKEATLTIKDMIIDNVPVTTLNVEPKNIELINPLNPII